LFGTNAGIVEMGMNTQQFTCAMWKQFLSL